ncbi:hypothetical protein RIF29_19472 [Crotalaria pallida]|uniref:OTU domain-containing protein n=1 Tax=Crotalaria pallida TaxID=3830 RepID=A0AAN9IBF6_CROPI
MKPPKYKVKTKGGVKGSRKEAAHEKSTKREPSHWEDDVMEAFPDVLHQFIHKIINVKADGNCGFRVLSLYRYGTEENYMLIRQEVIKEMINNKVLYVDILGQSYYDKAYNALYVDGLGAVSQAKWFEVPDMRHAVANLYNVGLVTISSSTDSLERRQNKEKPCINCLVAAAVRKLNLEKLVVENPRSSWAQVVSGEEEDHHTNPHPQIIRFRAPVSSVRLLKRTNIGVDESSAGVTRNLISPFDSASNVCVTNNDDASKDE